MNSPAQDLLQLLRNAGFSDDAIGWGMQPDEPARYITLQDTGGADTLRTLEGIENTRPTVKVLIRATLGADVWTDAQGAFAALKGYNLYLGGTVYQAVQHIQPPQDLGKDSRNRREVVFNLQIHRSG